MVCDGLLADRIEQYCRRPAVNGRKAERIHGGKDPDCDHKQYDAEPVAVDGPPVLDQLVGLGVRVRFGGGHEHVALAEGVHSAYITVTVY